MGQRSEGFWGALPSHWREVLHSQNPYRWTPALVDDRTTWFTFRPTLDQITIYAGADKATLASALPIEELRELGHSFRLESVRGKRATRIKLVSLPDRRALKLLKRYEQHLGTYRVTSAEIAADNFDCCNDVAHARSKRDALFKTMGKRNHQRGYLIATDRDKYGRRPTREKQEHKGYVAAYNDLFPMVKDSLGNALRVIRPVVVLDEGHRAISELAFRTLYGFNPCFVLELTATPKDVQPRGGKTPREARYANVLIEVTGRELDREGMIKMPLNLDPRQGTDWRATLNTALEKLNALDAKASALRADTGRYIRPIMLIQVERTGADQRGSGLIHAEDVKEWLLTAGFDEAETAIKTAEKNDLNQPENQDLLSPANRVRAIITKQALQEGWDCPFAYVLCALAASSNKAAMTQLVGRILRQPGALKTGVDALDECHVITHHADTADVVSAIKDGLEQDGLGDLVLQLAANDATGNAKVTRKLERRADFKSTEIYLPKVLLVEGAETRELDYETDVLAAIDWRGYDPASIAAIIPEKAQAAESQLQRISLAQEGDEFFDNQTVAASTETVTFDGAHAVRMISDIVLNPFVGREIVGRMIAALTARGFDAAKLGRLASLIVEELRKGLDKERSQRAEALFKDAVASGRIQFRLRMDGRNWRMPFTVETTEPEDGRKLAGKDGNMVKRSLFTPVYEQELNKDEQAVAVHLDGEETLKWWHRNVARHQYGLQGWKRGKVYPDFIFAISAKENLSRMVVLETKGDQLDNLDTAYKRELLSVMTDAFAWDTTVPAGTLNLIKDSGETVECALILMSEWKAKLPGYFKESSRQ